MSSSNASHYSSEQWGDEGLNLVNFTDFEDLLELSEEKCFLDAVSKGPVFEESFEKRDGEVSVFCQEKH